MKIIIRVDSGWQFLSAGGDGCLASAKKPFIAMKILLQHARTQLYLRSLGNWTADLREAYDFQHSQRAIGFAREHSITGVEIAVKFVDNQFEETFAIPVHLAEPTHAIA